MKRILIVCAFCLSNFFYAIAQKINYEPTLEIAKQKAMSSGKPIAILLTVKPPANLKSNQEGLNNSEVIEKFNTSFVNYKVAREDSTNSREVIRSYKIRRFPSFIFLDDKGGLLFTDVALTAKHSTILNLLNKALSFTGETSLVDLDSMYNAGKRESTFLKKYILKRQSAGLTNNADLIEQYVSGISISDLNKYEEVLFILKAGPLVDSNAYKLSKINKNISDSIYKTEPLEVRKAINNAIITNSLQSAIANKNISRANATASFTQLSWGKNYAEGTKSRMVKMIQYHKGIKDTATYLELSSQYFDRFFMSISVDSSKQKELANLAEAKANGTTTFEIDSATNKGVRRTSFTFRKNNADAVALNHAAWDFYNMSSKQEHLTKAMLWSRRSIELEPRAAYYDTYAHLLYKLELFTEAEVTQMKAIEVAKEEKTDIKAYQATLKRITSRTL